jgi:hypothetical protein
MQQCRLGTGRRRRAGLRNRRFRCRVDPAPAVTVTPVSSYAPQVRRRVHRLRAVAAAATMVVAVLLAAAAISWRTEDSAESKAYIAEPLYGVWGGLLLLQMVGLAALGLASYVWWQELRTLDPPPSPQGRRQAVGQWAVAAVFLGAALLAPAISMPDHYPRTYPDYLTWRVSAMGAFGVAAMAVTAAALVRIRTVAESLPAADGEAAERFRYLWGRQRQLLGASGRCWPSTCWRLRRSSG